MAYNYYCTYCGKELSQETVLFDMQAMLTGESTTFNILKFRMSLAELKRMMSLGTDVPGKEGYKACRLTLPELMAYIADPNNLDDGRIAALTMDDIRSYLDAGLDLSAASEPESTAPKSIFDDEEEEAAPVPVPEAQPAAQEDTSISPALRALESKSTKLADVALTKNTLSKDLAVLRNVFSENGLYEFQISLVEEEDNEKQPVCVGYTVVDSRTQVAHQPENVRVCPHCDGVVFKHAGTAKHQAVAFIGDQKAGKTSLILALTYYAENGAIVNLGDPIVADCDPIPALANVEPLSKGVNSTLSAELLDYSRGIAPEKTSSTKLAYSVTFRFRNKYEEGKHYILTLTDLPGELCMAGGSVDRAKVHNMFNVALACDAYILCFDCTTAKSGANAVSKIQDVCNWAAEFQQLRETHTNAKGYAPMMVAFTKCDAIGVDSPAERVSVMDVVKAAYMFKNEKAAIEKNRVFDFVGTKLKETDRLGTAYQSRLRCSPFGFAAPGSDAVGKDPSLNKDESGNDRIPRPMNVDKLLKWILMVTGCIPTDVKFHPTLGDSAVVTFEKNFISRTQLREQLPYGAGKDGAIRESACRCYLFENPGRVDYDYLKNCKNRSVLVGLELGIKLGLKKQ